MITMISSNPSGQPQNLAPGLKPLQLFELFFTANDMATLANQSNPRAALRGSQPLTVPEIYRYLGCLLYMGIYKCPEITDYWRRDLDFRLGLTLDRFNEIQRSYGYREAESSEEPDEW